MGETWEERSRRIVLGILAKRGWQLVRDVDSFAHEICGEIHRGGIVDADSPQERVAIERATIRHYCIVLHNACSEAGTLRQRAGFEELWRYLYPIALYKMHSPDLAQDLAQQTLIKTWKNLAQCREPGSFLSYAALILLNEMRDYYRRAGKHGEISGESGELEGETHETEMKHSSDTTQDSDLEQLGDKSGNVGLDRVINEESRRELIGIIQVCIKNRQQQTVLIRLFLDDRGYKEIAEELGVTVGNVHVLRHRALATLRKCERFIRFVEDRLS